MVIKTAQGLDLPMHQEAGFQTISAFSTLSRQCTINTCGSDRAAFFEQEILGDVFQDCVGCHGINGQNPAADTARGAFTIDPTDAASIAATLADTEERISRIDPNSGVPVLIAKPTGQAANHGGGNRTINGNLTPERLAKLQSFARDTTVCCRNGFAQFEALVNPLLTNGPCINCHGASSGRPFSITADDVNANFDAAVNFATRTANIGGVQVPVLLAQPSNQTGTHGDGGANGGVVIHAVGSPEYRIFESFVQTAASCSPRSSTN